MLVGGSLWWQQCRRARCKSGQGRIAAEMVDKHDLRTLMVWLSWIHEDVGHSAAAFVYNPVHTPMAVPMDGIGVPLASWAFNVLAYRGFVFLQRAVLLGQPPDYWFDKPKCTGMWPLQK